MKSGKTTPFSRRKQVLVLDAALQPLSRTSVLRAKVLADVSSDDHRAVVLAYTNEEGDRSPVVIKLNRLITDFSISIGLTRARVLRRDNWICQYCGVKQPLKELTVDHVLPKSRGGENSWENLTTACFTCNNQKGNRTPEEAGMKLLSIPGPPKDKVVLQLMVQADAELLDTWLSCLKEDDELLKTIDQALAG
jgi:hypothetical protein